MWTVYEGGASSQVRHNRPIPFKRYFLWWERSVSFSEAAALPPRAPLGESLLLNVFKTI